MNLDEIKSRWQAYQQEVGGQSYVTQGELMEMLNKNKKTTYPWYRPSQLTLLNACMCVLLMGMTGC
jgi:hypothetical protein